MIEKNSCAALNVRGWGKRKNIQDVSNNIFLGLCYLLSLLFSTNFKNRGELHPVNIFLKDFILQIT